MAIPARTIILTAFLYWTCLINAQDVLANNIIKDFEELRIKLNIPGVSFAVIKDSRIIISKSLGYDDMILQTPLTDSTPINVASITKTFAAYVIGKLHNEDKVSFSDFTSDFQIELGPKVKVEHLLSHTSLGEPGSRYYYNNSRYNKLDTVMYQSTGRLFASHMAEKIVQKIPLKNTFPNPYDTSDFRIFSGESSSPYINNIYTGYIHDSANVPVRSPIERAFAASAGLMSTAKDLVTYADFLMNDAEAKQIFSQLTEVRCSPEGKAFPYALGWFVEIIDSVKFVWHYGYMGTNSSLLIVVPEINLAFAILGNSNNLSRVYPLEEGTLLTSEAALLFVKYFVPILYNGALTNFTVSGRFAEQSVELENINRLLDYSEYRLRYYRGEGADTAYISRFRKNTAPGAIALLEADKNESKVAINFTIDSTMRVWFVSSAEEYFGELTDYGYCTDSGGNLVWTAREGTTLPAGGNEKNLYAVSEFVLLTPGIYTLHFITDDSHSPEFWSSLPPDDLFWGIYVVQDQK